MSWSGQYTPVVCENHLAGEGRYIGEDRQMGPGYCVNTLAYALGKAYKGERRAKKDKRNHRGRGAR